MGNEKQTKENLISRWNHHQRTNPGAVYPTIPLHNKEEQEAARDMGWMVFRKPLLGAGWRGRPTRENGRGS